jgi:tRNA-dihydrouridine synthase A
MVGRQAYHEPWQMAGWDEAFFGQAGPASSREQVEAAWLRYVAAQVSTGRPWTQSMRHALGLWNGQAGARRWRQVWSDHQYKALPPAEVAEIARQARVDVVAQLALQPD